ncbi:MAG: hypothetical protein QJR14_06085 [Bacillota bacterium]|nr:hypothetical protein [Bacillota bacterium]
MEPGERPVPGTAAEPGTEEVVRMKGSRLRVEFVAGRGQALAEALNAWLAQHPEEQVVQMRWALEAEEGAGVYIVYEQERPSRSVGFAREVES